MIEYIVTFLSIVVILILIAVLHKVRRIHITSFYLAERVDDIHRESRHLYAQIQAYIDLKSLLEMDIPLPTLRGWAASPDFLLIIAKNILSTKPQIVVECSSGASTIVIARCLQLNGTGHVYSLENDPIFANITRDNISSSDLVEWSTIIEAPLEPVEKMPDHVWYSADGYSDLHDIDVLIIDGPPASSCKLARYPALPILKNRLKNDARIFLDDSDREDEKEIIQLWMKEDNSLRSMHIPCEKGCEIIYRDKFNV